MHRSAIVLIGMSLLAFLASPSRVTLGGEELWGVRGLIWVTNRTLNSVALFDAGTGVLRGSVPVGNAPIGILVPPGTGKVYVSNEGSNTMSVLSASTLAQLKTVATGPRPHHMAYDPSGRFVYVAEFNSNQIGVIDTRTDERVKGLSASGSAAARTHASWPVADGTVYAVSEVSNELAAINGTTGQLLWTIGVGNRPSEVLVTPDGRTAFVSIRNEDMIKVVDLRSRTITGQAIAGTQPDTLSLTGDGRTLIVGLRGSPAFAAFVDVAALKTTWVEVGGTTTGHQWLSEDSRFTFMAVEGPGDLGSIAVINNARRRLETSYPYPKGGRPHGVYYQPMR